MRRWVISLVACLVAAGANAEQAPRIAVVHDGVADLRTIARLRLELETLGLRVVEVALADDDRASSLDDAARRVDAFAAVRVIPARSGVEVWVADRVTGKTLLRELLVGPGDVVDDVVALQAVELLRASLAELGLSSVSRGDVAPSPAVRRIVPRPPPEPRSPPGVLVLAQVGPGVALSPGGFAATGHGFVGLRWRPAGAIGLDVWALLPVSPASVEAEEGSATLAPLLVGADAALWAFEPAASWQLSAGAGVAIARLSIQGQAVSPFKEHEDPLTVATAMSRVSFGKRFGSRFGLGFDGFVGVAMPEPIIRFNGRTVAHWGRPLVVGALSFDVGLD